MWGSLSVLSDQLGYVRLWKWWRSICHKRNQTPKCVEGSEDELNSPTSLSTLLPLPTLLLPLNWQTMTFHGHHEQYMQRETVACI